MKAKKLENLYWQYLDENREYMPEMQSGDLLCSLYGQDEFHINYKQSTLYLKNLGVMDLPEIKEQINFDWIGLIHYPDNQADLVFGLGSPYAPDNVDKLPTKNGCIMALPYALGMRLREKNQYQ